MADRGVPVIFGSDAGLTAFDNFGEVFGEVLQKNWSQWGFDASQAIELATVEAARALRSENVTGQLEPGLSAGPLVVSGDPLDGLDALGRLCTRATPPAGVVGCPTARRRGKEGCRRERRFRCTPGLGSRRRDPDRLYELGVKVAGAGNPVCAAIRSTV